MLTPEEKAILQNIKSLVSQIDQVESGEGEVMGGVEGMEPEENLNVALPEEEEEEEKEMKSLYRRIMKQEAEGSKEDEAEDRKEDLEENPLTMKAEGAQDEAEAATARDDADERIDDRGDAEEEALKLVKSLIKKGYLKPATPKRAVQKSARTAELAAIMELTKVVKSLSVEMRDTQGAMAGMLEGLGIADEIKATAARKPVNKEVRKGLSREDILMDIREALTGSVNKPADKVEKSLSGVVGSLWANQR